MKILHIENWSEATNAFIQELHRATGCRIEHAESFDEGLFKIAEGRGNIDLVLYTVAPTSSGTLSFPDRVRAVADDALFRRPHLILLGSSPLTLPCAVKCMDRQVVYLLRDYPKQILETAKVLLWKIRTSKPGPTIRIAFRGGHHRFFICGTATSEEIVISRQIGRLLLLLLRGTSTVEALAEELGVLPQTVKKYMRALRLIIESLLERLNMTGPNANVVRMNRGPGGTVCSLRANSVWD